jgi:hypothetical protein
VPSQALSGALDQAAGVRRLKRERQDRFRVLQALLGWLLVAGH